MQGARGRPVPASYKGSFLKLEREFLPSCPASVRLSALCDSMSSN